MFSRARAREHAARLKLADGTAIRVHRTDRRYVPCCKHSSAQQKNTLDMPSLKTPNNQPKKTYFPKNAPRNKAGHRDYVPLYLVASCAAYETK